MNIIKNEVVGTEGNASLRRLCRGMDTTDTKFLLRAKHKMDVDVRDNSYGLSLVEPTGEQHCTVERPETTASLNFALG